MGLVDGKALGHDLSFILGLTISLVCASIVRLRLGNCSFRGGGSRTDEVTTQILDPRNGGPLPWRAPPLVKRTTTQIQGRRRVVRGLGERILMLASVKELNLSKQQ